MFFCTWVCELIIILKFAVGQVGVDLSRGERCVSEQALDGVEVGPVVEHVGGEGVPEHVGRTFGRRHLSVEHAVHHAVYELVVYRAAVGPDEECVGGRQACGRGAQAAVEVDEVGELVAERDCSFFIRRIACENDLYRSYVRPRYD